MSYEELRNVTTITCVITTCSFVLGLALGSPIILGIALGFGIFSGVCSLAFMASNTV
jgi:hypothetical protein